MSSFDRDALKRVVTVASVAVLWSVFLFVSAGRARWVRGWTCFVLYSSNLLAQVLGFGGVTAVARASGLSRGTVIRGIAELKTSRKLARGQRVRRKGAGRKRTVDRDATLQRDLEDLVEPVTRGDPESPLAVDLPKRAAVGQRTSASRIRHGSACGTRGPTSLGC